MSKEFFELWKGVLDTTLPLLKLHGYREDDKWMALFAKKDDTTVLRNEKPLPIITKAETTAYFLRGEVKNSTLKSTMFQFLKFFMK